MASAHIFVRIPDGQDPQSFCLELIANGIDIVSSTPDPTVAEIDCQWNAAAVRKQLQEIGIETVDDPQTSEEERNGKL
ncbi:MAG: hypothetical protein WCV62_00765 [Candidatus Peribacteraceae bacterium]|jgi:hypothetical protein